MAPQNVPQGSFVCDACVTKTHKCYVCQDSTATIACLSDCGKFYHVQVCWGSILRLADRSRRACDCSVAYT